MTTETKLEKRIRELEDLSLIPDNMRGTILSRCTLDVSLMEKSGMEVKDDGRHFCSERRYRFVWCAAVGGMEQPKVFGYGYNINEALDDAERIIRLMLAAKRKIERTQQRRSQQRRPRKEKGL